MKKEYTYEVGDVVTMKKPHPSILFPHLHK